MPALAARAVGGQAGGVTDMTIWQDGNWHRLPTDTGKKITDLSLVTGSFYSIKDLILDGGIQQASAPMFVLLRHPHPQGMTATARGVTPTQPAMECCSIYSLADKLIQS